MIENCKTTQVERRNYNILILEKRLTALNVIALNQKLSKGLTLELRIT